MKEQIETLKSELKNVKKIKSDQRSLYLEILSEEKKRRKALIIGLTLSVIFNFLLLFQLVYLYNDIGVEETTTTTEDIEVIQDNKDGYNNYIGDNGDINNG